MSEIENIDLRSNDVQEVLNRPPKWILRNGIVLVFIILTGILVGSCFFKYPDVLSAPIVITTENLPFDIVAKSSRRIDTIMVKNKQQVFQNQLLGVLENSAKTSDVLFLDSVLNCVNLSVENSGIEVFSVIDKYLKLGELQPIYANLIKSVESLSFFIKTDYYSKKIRTLTLQKNVQQRIVKQNMRLQQISLKQLNAAYNQFKIDSALYKKDALSSFEYENSKKTYLQVVQNYEYSQSNIESQKIALLQSEQQILDLEQQKNEQFLQLKTDIYNNLENLKSQIVVFKQTYYLISQIDGIVAFTNYSQKNQNVLAGETIMTIVPKENKKIVGKIYLSPKGAGKVKVGQRINVKLDDFPYNEYGILHTEVKSISLVPTKRDNTNQYVIQVEFPSKLQTTYGKTIDFRQQMVGHADIITEDTRLIERLLNPLRAIFDK